ncbi:DUF2526 family protein [Escherichia albertii]|nr:DUF2526 family protein [Escherichia albertii]
MSHLEEVIARVDAAIDESVIAGDAANLLI